MKRIIILITIILLATGCYDNIELNKLAIVSGLGIDYEDGNYEVTYEILNDIKTEDNTAMLSYTISGKGKSLSSAMADANYRVGKKAYFSHLKIVILSNSVIKGHFENITDYLLRDTNIRDEFILMVANNTTPKEILEHNSDDYPIVSDKIISSIDNEKYNNNLAINEIYQKVLAKLINPYYDIILSSISLINNEVSLDNFYIFKDYNYQNILSKLDSRLYMLLTENVYALNFNKEFAKGNVIISVTSSKSDIDVDNEKININLNLEGKIVENNAKWDLKEEKVYKKLNEEFAKVIKEDVTNFIYTLQDNKSDVLGLSEIYYKKYRKDNKDLWQSAQVDVKVDLKINTKGYIFEVN